MSGVKQDLLSEPSEAQTSDERRLWIGNLDPRITELTPMVFSNWYQLLKLIQKHGAIEKFDLLFHRAGPLAGQPRGYAFVTFVNKEDAAIAKAQLHNKQVGSKNVVVTWAHSMSGEEPGKPKSEIVIPALAMSKCENKVNRESQIEAIEAKLKLMERKDVQDFEINKTVAAEPPIISLYQKKHESSTTTGSCSNSLKNRSNTRRNDKRRTPYNKLHLRK